MKNRLAKFAKAKRTILALGICLLITLAVSFHEDLLLGKRNTTNLTTPTVSGGSSTAVAPQIERPSKSARLWEFAEKLLITLCALLMIHLFDQGYLMDEVIQNTKEALDTVVDRHIHLIDSSNKCGIADIYSNRLTARKDIMGDIEDAKDRIWLLGVGLNVQIDVENLLPNLRDKKKAGADVRILMLDAFRSTAVFRTFLESGKDHAERIINYYEKLCTEGISDPKEKEVYFNERLSRRFESTCKALQNTPELESCVKFYAHTPSCWLIITGNKAYFQPYALGSHPPQPEISPENDVHVTHTSDETIGDLLPVFKFQSHKNISTFRVLEDHFLKLWATSDCSLFHIQARQSEKEGILRRVFETRREWLRYVYNILYTTRGKESYNKKPGEIVQDESGQKRYRSHERQICPDPVKCSFEFKSRPSSNGQKTFHGRIVDSSREGIAILTSDALNHFTSDELAGMEIEVRLEDSTPSTNPLAIPKLTDFFEQVLLSRNNRFEIKNAEVTKTANQRRLGLKKVA